MTRSKSVSLWYAEYPGDYGRKTAHLSLAEHGAYLLLRHHYYSTGRPLPANAPVLHRICSALADEEKAAVQSVLDQFFDLREDGYHNDRCDEELAKRGDIKEKRRAAAAAMHANRAASADANAGASAYTPTPTLLPSEEIVGVGVGARDASFFSRVLVAAGYNPADILPTHWMPPKAELEVTAWLDLPGMTEALAERHVAESTRAKGRANGPKAFTDGLRALSAQRSAPRLVPIDNPAIPPPRDVSRLVAEAAAKQAAELDRDRA